MPSKTETKLPNYDNILIIGIVMVYLLLTIALCLTVKN